MIFIVDTQTWIEYFKGSKEGARARSFIDGKNNTVLTPNIVSAEIVSKMKRLGENYENGINAIKNLSITPIENQDIYFEAGILHAEMREKLGNISLADAIIIIIAEKNNAKILTKDFHLKGKNTILLA